MEPMTTPRRVAISASLVIGLHVLLRCAGAAQPHRPVPHAIKEIVRASVEDHGGRIPPTIQATLRKPIFVGPLRLERNPHREAAARQDFEEVIKLFQNLPETDFVPRDYRRPEIWTTLASFIERHDGTAAALTARLVVGVLQTDPQHAWDADIGWAVLAALGDSGLNSWQTSAARELMATFHLEYSADHTLLREQLARLETELQVWQQLHRRKGFMEDWTLYQRVLGLSSSLEDERAGDKLRLRSYLRLGDLPKARQVARKLVESPYHDTKSAAEATSWLKDIEKGGNPWADGRMGELAGESSEERAKLRRQSPQSR